MNTVDNSWKETLLEVNTFLDKLRYALEHGAKINIQMDRSADMNRSDYRCTTRYTIMNLFPNQKPSDAVKEEMKKLTEKNYLRTLKDDRYPERGELREFGMIYSSNRHVYIKIRADLTSLYRDGNHIVFILSFHYAEYKFKKEDFPYR